MISCGSTNTKVTRMKFIEAATYRLISENVDWQIMTQETTFSTRECEQTIAFSAKLPMSIALQSSMQADAGVERIEKELQPSSAA